ncbi:MAG TPA: hypothetical protein VLW86_13760 [Syntrophorhabdales bacterium]|nr:hypothetical protein [Syntrophorhabdales bacterium]
MNMPEFAKDLTLRGDTDNHILSSGDIALMLYERRHYDELRKGPLVKVARQKKVKRRRNGNLEVAQRAPGSLSPTLAVGYSSLAGGPTLIYHFLWLLTRLSRFIHSHRLSRRPRVS